jgi:hypothetical protein
MDMPPWTYSRLEKFETCPKQFFHTKVLKDVFEPPTEATIWGKVVHIAFEKRIRDGTPLPEGMTQWEGIASRIEKLPGRKLMEHEMALDDAYRPTEWNQAWTRGIADVVVLNGKQAAVLDYKTGKQKPSEQLNLYAAYIMAHFPEVERVETGYIWLKTKTTSMEHVERSGLSEIWRNYLSRVSRLHSAYTRNSWPARPSGLCNGWCPVKACTHWKDRK